MSKGNNNNIGIRKAFEQIDKKYHNTHKFLGKSILTKPSKINSARGLMFSSHQEQFEIPNNPDIPKISYGYENLVGEYSSGYLKLEDNLEVVDKIIKFDYEGASNDVRNLSYLLVTYNSETDTYDVIKKVLFEKLTEDYGYKYNTEVIDDIEVGDYLDKGDILYRSGSYDNHMNYRMGKNAMSAVMIDTDTTEDGMKIRRGFAEQFDSTKIDVIRIPMNKNDVLINLFGKGGKYVCIPDIGQVVKKKKIAAQRRLTYSQILFDMKQENLSKFNRHTDTSFYTKEGSRVVDINIYRNKPIDELDDSAYNEQIIKYCKIDEDYHKQIVRVLSKYKKMGNTGDELNYLLKRSMSILDPDTKWKDGDGSVFDNIILELTVLKPHKVSRGTKFTGRYGNKGVVAVIEDDDRMPIVTETGRPLDIIINATAPFGRLIPAMLDEIECNFILDRVNDLYIKPANGLEERKQIAYDILQDLAPAYGQQFEDTMENFDIQTQENIMENMMEDGIRMVEDPFWNNTTFERFRDVYEKWEIPKYHLHTYRFGRKVKILNTHVCGDMYMLKLKHTAGGKFSARSTSHVSTLGLPEKSNATKNNKAQHKDTPVKLGEQEMQNLMISQDMNFVKTLNMTMATSLKARRNSAELYTCDVFDFDGIEIDDECTNRNVEVLKVKLNAMGYDIQYVDLDTGEIIEDL